MAERIVYEDSRIQVVIRDRALPPVPEDPDVSPLYGLVNAHRQMAGVAPVQRDEEAEQVAQGWAEELTRSSFRHNPHLAAEISGDWFAFGENIAKGQGTEDEAHRDWAASLGHWRNMTNPNFTHMGVGHAGDAWVEVFVDRLP